MSKGSSF